MKRFALAIALPMLLVGPALAADPGQQAKALMKGYFDSYVADLRTITNIDSGTGDAEGSRKIAEFLKGKLEPMGAKVEFRSNARSTHVIARFKGEGRLKLLLMAHTDTVFLKGDAAKRPFRMDAQRRAYGPGVGDDKATVMQTVYAMQVLKDLDHRKYGEIVLYFDGEEETGSDLTEAIIKELSAKVDAVLVLDTARPNWGIVTKRKGRAEYEIKVSGRSGHAGNAAHHAASAVMELGYQLTKLHQLASPLPKDPGAFTRESLEQRGIKEHGQFVPANTINVGVIQTPNQKLNVIPDQAVAKLEVRCFETKEQERLDRAIRALAKQPTVGGTTVTVTGEMTGTPMEKTPAVQVLVDAYRDVVKREYGAEVIEYSAGGLTDGNISSPYAPTIDALGIENYDEHTDREWVDLNTVEPRTVALVGLIQELEGRLDLLKKAR